MTKYEMIYIHEDTKKPDLMSCCPESCFLFPKALLLNPTMMFDPRLKLSQRLESATHLNVWKFQIQRKLPWTIINYQDNNHMESIQSMLNKIHENWNNKSTVDQKYYLLFLQEAEMLFATYRNEIRSLKKMLRFLDDQRTSQKARLLFDDVHKTPILEYECRLPTKKEAKAKERK